MNEPRTLSNRMYDIYLVWCAVYSGWFSIKRLDFFLDFRLVVALAFWMVVYMMGMICGMHIV